MAPGAAATNPRAHAVENHRDLDFFQAVHRDLVLGTGFHRVLRCGDDDDKDMPSKMQAFCREKSRGLPVVNLLDINDKDFLDSPMLEVLEDDCARFKAYFSTLLLGLGLITAVSTPRPLTAFKPLTCIRDLALERRRQPL